MPNVSDLLTRTLKLVGAIGEGQVATNEQLGDALDALNDMLAEWYGRGIYINDGDLTLIDDWPTDPEDARGVRFNLAVEIAPEYDRQLPSSITITAMDSMTALKTKYYTVQEMDIDEALKSDYSFNINTGS